MLVSRAITIGVNFGAILAIETIAGRTLPFERFSGSNLSPLALLVVASDGNRARLYNQSVQYPPAHPFQNLEYLV